MDTPSCLDLSNLSSLVLDPTQVVGRVTYVAGPVVKAKGLRGCTMREKILVGEAELIGEIIFIKREEATIQVFEATEGLALGEPVKRTGMEVCVELGPGLIGSVYDGIQRPLDSKKLATNIFIPLGFKDHALSRTKQWHFTPRYGLQLNQPIMEGDEAGYVIEGGEAAEEGGCPSEVNRTANTKTLKHLVQVPPGTRAGVVQFIAVEGANYTVDDVVLRVGHEDATQTEVKLMQVWRVRYPRPNREKLIASIPLETGQRCLDTLFPILRGGTAAIPGAFGCGKTSLIKAIAKHSKSDVLVFVGCGERGNEIAELLKTFKKLLSRSVVIANTSNMPVASREASIYTGITIAEYYRDMGLHVTLVADSTSRWAEALREISGRLGETPGESGYPTYLNYRIAEFYERAGPVRCLNASGKEDKFGSVTLIGAVSPPAGDFSDPVTQATLSVVQAFWGLSPKLASERHYPAVNWNTSYKASRRPMSSTSSTIPTSSTFVIDARTCSSEGRISTPRHRCGASSLCRTLIESPTRLFNSSRLISSTKMVMDLRSSNSVEKCCPFSKTVEMLATILDFYELANKAVQGNADSPSANKVTWDCIEKELEEEITTIGRLRFEKSSDRRAFNSKCQDLRERFKKGLSELKRGRGKSHH